jgi:hypothetical protein
MEARWKSTIVRPAVSVSPSPDSSPKNTKSHLAVAIAQGESAAAWASQNGVDKRIAQRWAREPNVRTAVESSRRRAVDKAVGVMYKHLKKAAKQIVTLGESAASESVRLAARRADLSDMMVVSKFGVLEERLTEVEEHIRADIRNTNRAG